MDSRKSRVKSPMEEHPPMIQRLSVVSVLVLIVLAGAGSVLVATRAFGSAPSSLGGSQLLLSPSGANAGSVSQTTVQMTSTITVTSTNSSLSAASTSSTSVPTTTTTQNSTSSAGGSLLVTGQPSSGSNSTCHDDCGGDD